MQAGREIHNNSTVRLWKSNPSYCKPEYVDKFLRSHKIGGPETEFKSISDDPDIEENTGTEFPGL